MINKNNINQYELLNNFHMSCHDKNAFIENSIIEELICLICLDVMTVPIMMSCGNGCVIGEDCYKDQMRNCPKCNEKLFFGCNGCCVDECESNIIEMQFCGHDCTGCNGTKLYND